MTQIPCHDPAPTLQLVTFQAAPGVAGGIIHAALERIATEYFATVPTYRGHDVTQRPDGTWVEVVYSTDLDAARALCAGWSNRPCTDALLTLIRPETVRETFLTAVPATVPSKMEA